MFCNNCGANLPDGVKFCTSCGNKIAAERISAPADFDLDATIIADPVESFDPASRVAHYTPAEPAEPVSPPANPASAPYVNPVQPVAPYNPSYPTYPQQQTPSKQKPDVKLIAIIAGAVAIIVAIIILIVSLAGNGGKNKEDDPKPAPSVASVVKERMESRFSRYSFSNYKSEYKIRTNNAYYQLFTTIAVNENGETEQYVLAEATVFNDEVQSFDVIKTFDVNSEDAFYDYTDSYVENLATQEESIEASLLIYEEVQDF